MYWESCNLNTSEDGHQHETFSCLLVVKTKVKSVFLKWHHHADVNAETAELAYAKKTKESQLIPRNLALRTSGNLLIVFSTKVDLLHLLYSMTWRCCLLHLIKHICLLKTFLTTLILMTQVSLYPLSLLEVIWNFIIFL